MQWALGLHTANDPAGISVASAINLHRKMARSDLEDRPSSDAIVRTPRRIAKQVALVLLILLVLSVLARIIPQKQVYSLAALIVVALAFVMGMRLVLESTHALIAWLIACGIVPCYMVLLSLVTPTEPEKFIDIAYLFGSLYGAVASGAGVLGGIVVRRRRNLAKGN